MRNRDEPVRLTKIYTRGGDAGETSLGDGSRVSKLDPRIVAYGIVDELNSHIGVVLAGDLPDVLHAPLARIQNELFDVGADLSVPQYIEDRLRTTQEMIDGLERLCDELNAPLPELKSFVLPGGSERAARLFLARAVCRRAERSVLTVPDANPVTEETPGRPLGSYGRAKLQSEMLCRDAVAAGLDVTIVRPRTILGHGRLGYRCDPRGCIRLIHVHRGRDVRVPLRDLCAAEGIRR